MINATDVDAIEAREVRWLGRVGLVAGPLVAAILLATPAPEGWKPEAHRLLAVLSLTIIWWVTETLPLAATGLAAIALAGALGAVPGEDPVRVALAPFADPSVFFLLGGMFLARAMTRSGLDRRIALSILCHRAAGQSPGRLLAAVGLSVAVISTSISNTAATAMVYPVTMGMIATLATGGAGKGFLRSPYASGLLLMTAYASSAGGVATPIGTATNVVAMGFFRQKEYFGQPVDFLRWMTLGTPLALALIVALVVWLRFVTGSKGLDLASLRNYLLERREELGAWRREEAATALVFALIATLWIAPAITDLLGLHALSVTLRRRFPEELVALWAPVLLFLTPVGGGRRALEADDFGRIDWGTILLFGAGMAIGNLMFRTGLAEQVGRASLAAIGTRDVWIVTALAIGGAIVLSEFTSNAATAATLIPVIAQLCRAGDIDPTPPLLGATLGASFGSALPVSTPPNAIVYGSGLIPLGRMIRAGVGLDLLSGLLIWLALRTAFALGWSPLAR